MESEEVPQQSRQTPQPPQEVGQRPQEAGQQPQGAEQQPQQTSTTMEPASPRKSKKVPDVPIEVWEKKLVGKRLVEDDAPDDDMV